MSDLRSRAKNYLNGPRIISEPGAGLTRLIARYVTGKPWDDPELRNLLSLGVQTAQTEAAKRKGDISGSASSARVFYETAAALLQDIQAEVSAG